MKAAMNTVNSANSCCASATAAGTSVRAYEILGTVILAVSIFVRLLGVLIFKV